MRSDLPEWERLAVQVGRGVFCVASTALCVLSTRGVRRDRIPGFPGSSPPVGGGPSRYLTCLPLWWFHPMPTEGASSVWWRLGVKGLPSLRFRDKGRRLEGIALGGGAKVKELRVVRTPLRTEIHVVVRHPEGEMPQVEPSNPVGIDVGLTQRLTLSDGSVLPPRRKIDASSIKRAQRRFSRAKKGSRSRGKKALSLAKAHRREKERAVQADFRLAHRLVQTHDGIAVENLNVSGMLRSKRFSKKMSEQRWSSLGNILEYKAEKAGIPFERVDPKHTTTGCASCGHRQPMPLGIRVFHCGVLWNVRG